MHTPRKTVTSIGIIGFGAFGRLMAHHLQPHFRLRVFDPDQPAQFDDSGKGLVPGDIAEIGACDLVILAVPVGAVPSALAGLAPHLRAGAIVLDVGSVKIAPALAMQAGLPDHVEIVGTHPLFGPQSGKDGIAGLRIAVCPVRGDKAAWRVAAFCRKALGRKVFVVTPEDHDREAATVQGLTHLIAKVLLAMEPLPTRMTTASFDRLMQAVDMVRHDSPAVFRAIERDNPFAAEVRERFFTLADEARGGVASN